MGGKYGVALQSSEIMGFGQADFRECIGDAQAHNARCDLFVGFSAKWPDCRSNQSTRGPGFDQLKMNSLSQSLRSSIGSRLRRFHANVGPMERASSMLAGSALVAAAWFRPSSQRWMLLGAGTALMIRGATGYCSLYHALGIDRCDRRERDGVPGNEGVRVEYTVDIHCPAADLYQFWRCVDQLPKILRHVESVQAVDEWHSHWVARGPLGPALEWDAEIINEHENQLIAWQSVHGADLKNAGSVRFEPLDEEITRMKVCLELQPIGGTAALTLARLFGTDPQRELETDLERFKDFAERELTPTSQSLN
jgi:uncharacterized membrane protein